MCDRLPVRRLKGIRASDGSWVTDAVPTTMASTGSTE